MYEHQWLSWKIMWLSLQKLLLRQLQNLLVLQTLKQLLLSELLQLLCVLNNLLLLWHHEAYRLILVALQHLRLILWTMRLPCRSVQWMRLLLVVLNHRILLLRQLHVQLLLRALLLRITLLVQLKRSWALGAASDWWRWRLANIDTQSGADDCVCWSSWLLLAQVSSRV